MKRSHEKLLTTNAQVLAKGISINHGQMLSQLLADGVIADTNVTRVGEIDYLHSYFVHLSVVQRATQ